MRIMQLASGLLVNGAVLQCLALTRALAARGHDVYLACRPGAWIESQVKDSDITVIRSELRRWPAPDARELAVQAEAHGIELLHTHQSRAHVCGLFVRWHSGIPCIATAHSRHLKPHWCLNDFVIANSQATFDFHHRWNFVPRVRMRVVNYLLELDRFEREPAESGNALRREWGCQVEDRIVGVIGDIIPRKGHLHLVRAWPQIVAAVPQARLMFIGAEKEPAYAARIREAIKALGVGDSVHFAGYKTEMPAVMQAIDLCVSSAVEEALGLTIPEAMSARKAVVATRVGGMPENVWPNETGFLVPPAKPAAMAAAIIQLLADDRRRLEFGQSGWRRVREKYDPASQIREVENIYEHVMAAKRRARMLAQRPLARRTWGLIESRV